MKYIRTKDGRIYQVYDKVFEYKGDKRYQLVDSRFEISLNDIVKQADTIEELCDLFVVVLGTSKRVVLNKPDFELYLKKDNVIEIYGLTDANGLNYVAKWNKRRELELL